LAGRGLSVTLVARADEHRDRPGESLSPAANGLLAELGVADAFAAGPHRQSNATFSAWGSPLLAQRNSVTQLDGVGHVIDRTAFERMLTDAVARTAIPVQSDIPPARFIIDCSGRAAVVGRRFAARRRVDRLLAACAFLPQREPNVEPTQATLIETVPEGWWYASLVPDGRLALALFADHDTMPRHIGRDGTVWRAAIGRTQYIEQWIDSACFDADTPVRLAGAGTSWLDPVYGYDWIAAGDAAASFDPLSSHGITSALWTGRKAALAAAAALRGDDTPLKAYGTTMQQVVEDFLRQRRAIYGRERRFSDHPFWRRRGTDMHDNPVL